MFRPRPRIVRGKEGNQMPEYEYPKVDLRDEINIKPWSECSGANCQHPDCIAKRKEIEQIKNAIKTASFSEVESKRRTARKKLKRLRQRTSCA